MSVFFQSVTRNLFSLYCSRACSSYCLEFCLLYLYNVITHPPPSLEHSSSEKRRVSLWRAQWIRLLLVLGSLVRRPDITFVADWARIRHINLTFKLLTAPLLLSLKHIYYLCDPPPPHQVLCPDINRQIQTHWKCIRVTDTGIDRNCANLAGRGREGGRGGVDYNGTAGQNLPLLYQLTEYIALCMRKTRLRTPQPP